MPLFLIFSKCWCCKKWRHTFLLPSLPSPPPSAHVFFTNIMVRYHVRVGSPSCTPDSSIEVTLLTLENLTYALTILLLYTKVWKMQMFTPIRVAHFLSFFLLTSRCATSLFLGLYKQVCHRWVCYPLFFVAQQARVPPAIYVRGIKQVCHRGRVPADEGNCI